MPLPHGQSLTLDQDFLNSWLSGDNLRLGYLLKSTYRSRQYSHDEVKKYKETKLLNVSNIIIWSPLPMDINDPIKNEPAEEAPDEDVKELMESHDLDKDTAERVQEIMEDLGVDEDDAVEIEESL